MKTIKRIIAVILLITTVALVGYLVFTGSQLSNINEGGINAAISNI